MKNKVSLKKAFNNKKFIKIYLFKIQNLLAKVHFIKLFIKNFSVELFKLNQLNFIIIKKFQ